jgi:hypothetical protein
LFVHAALAAFGRPFYSAGGGQSMVGQLSLSNHAGQWQTWKINARVDGKTIASTEKKAKTFFPRCYGDESRSGANPTTSEFTTTTPAL